MKYHDLRWLNRNLFSHTFGGWSLTSRCQPEHAPSETVGRIFSCLFPALVIAINSWHFLAYSCLTPVSVSIVTWRFLYVSHFSLVRRIPLVILDYNHDIILTWLHLQRHYFTNTVTFSQMPEVRISLHIFCVFFWGGGGHNLTHDRNLRQTKFGSSWEGAESKPWRLQSKEHHPTTSWWWASLMWA